MALWYLMQKALFTRTSHDYAGYNIIFPIKYRMESVLKGVYGEMDFEGEGRYANNCGPLNANP